MSKLSDKKLRKILIATLATNAICCYPAVISAAGNSDVIVNGDDSSDWTNNAGATVVIGGGSETFEGNVSDRYTEINGGNFQGVFGGMTSSGNVHGNTVYFNGGNVEGGIVGGFTFYYDGLNVGNVWGNRVVMTGGTANWLTGGEVGYVSSNSNFSNLTGGDVLDNTVDMYGGTVTGGIIGGSALTGNAKGNTVNISGGTVTGNIIGGEVKESSSGQAVNNTINIYGSPNLSSANLYGGIHQGNGYSLSNTLNIYTSGISVGNIGYDSFDRLNFYTPYYLQNGGTVLNITTENPSSSGFSLDKISFSPDGDSTLTTGDTVNLIVNGIDTNMVDSRNITISKGLLWDYAGVLSAENGNVTATIGDKVEQSSNPIPHNREDQIAHLQIAPPDPFTQPMTDSLFEDEDEYGETNMKALNGYNIFLNTGGGRLKTKTGGGTYIRSSRGNYDLGFARSLDSQAGKLYIAPVFEHVTGHYNAFLPSNKFGEVHGHGTTKYTAGGFIARRMNNNGFYYEGSFRGGRVENSFASNDFIRNDGKVRGEYKSESPVFTGHIRLGSAKRLNKDNVLDVYGTYFYTRQNGDDVDIYSNSGKDHVSFNAVQNHTLRLGYRLTTRTSRISRIYTGLAYQYDRSSSSTATSADGYSRTADGVKGSSGMLELGWQIKPNKNNMWLVDINATGWLGHHQGFNLMAKAQKSF